MMLLRFQQIMSLTKLTHQKKQTLLLLASKVQDKIFKEIKHIDCEDLLALVRAINKLQDQLNNVDFAYKAIGFIAKRMSEADFITEARTFYDFSNWLSLVGNINQIVFFILVKSESHIDD